MLLVNEIKPGVVEVRLNRPEIHNAFNDELIELMISEFQKISANESVRVVVLTGEGRSFCAGADLNWMKSMVKYSEAENKADSEKLFELFETINNCPIPVIGKINGHALGGGVGLVSVCDFVCTHEKAKFGFTEVRLGLIPAVISSFSMRKIGETNARAWFLSGERFSSHVAKDIGLVHQVGSLEDFESDFESILDSYVKAGPKAARAAKALIKGLEENKDIKSFTCGEIAKIRVSEEGQEGMSALLEKRNANWN